MLTQIVRYGRMAKLQYTSIRCRVRAHWTSEGSVFAGTISSTCHSVEIHTEIESDDDPALIAAVIANAQGGCYADAALSQPVPVFRTVDLNKSNLDVDAFPRQIRRRSS